jgi:cell division protein FtsB
MMRNQSLQRKRIIKSIIEKMLIVLFILLITYFIKEGLNIYSKYALVKHKTVEAHKEHDELKLTLEKKQRDLDFLKSQRGKEEYLRTTLPVASEGEKVIILYDATSSPFTEIKLERSWWSETLKKLKYFRDNYTNL